jgi:hypothetical protein
VAFGEYKIKLSRDVALVLFEWLVQHHEEDWAGVPFTHPGELSALALLTGALERTVVESFDPRYDELLSAARDRLAPQIETDDE